MDNKNNKCGFSGLSDLASKVSSIDDIVESPTSEKRSSPIKESPSISQAKPFPSIQTPSSTPIGLKQIKTLGYITITLSAITFLIIAGVTFVNFNLPSPNLFNLPIINIREEIWPMYLFLSFFLMIITWYEVNYLRILDIFTFPGILVALILSFYLKETSFLYHLIGMFAASFPLYLVALIFTLKTKREGIGGGVIKLAAMIGAFIGVIKVTIALSFSILIVILYLFYNKNIYKNDNNKITIEVGPLLSIFSLTTIFIPYEEFIKALF